MIQSIHTNWRVVGWHTLSIASDQRSYRRRGAESAYKEAKWPKRGFMQIYTAVVRVGTNPAGGGCTPSPSIHRN